MAQKKSTSSYSSLCRRVEHPVLQHKLTLLRKKGLSAADFRRILTETSSLLAYEVTRDLKTAPVAIETPMEGMRSPLINEPLIVISIMRAGNGMLEGMLHMLPFARVGHVGIYRDKFLHSTVEYYFRLPGDAKGQRVLIIDPILATGDTAVAAINRLKEYKVGKITFCCLISAPEGLRNLKEAHPDVEIVTLAVDRQLNPKGYILPGIGDAGDRLFDTF
jgi:uracil phosphoribosyltransferase